MSYYTDCKAGDILTWLEPVLGEQGYHLRWGDGKLYAELRMHHDTPWHHVKHDGRLDCHLWHAILFDIVFPRMEKNKWVPAKCQECYKVVVRPKTLKQLFALKDLQKRLDLPCKCGIEVRETVHGLYGGYFYNVGLEQGLECYKTVRDAVNKDPLLGKDVAVLLKRACTEYEMRCGPSNKWEITDEQLAVEGLVEHYLCHDAIHQEQPDHVVRRVHKKWVEFAYAAGDETYKDFTDGLPLYPAYVTFHHLVSATGAKAEKGSAPNKEK